MSALIDDYLDLLLQRNDDFVWVDSIAIKFQCVKCHKTLIRHYIANCGHKFCRNCKNVLDDGRKVWRCPFALCFKIIENMDLQDSNFHHEVCQLKTHCPNYKYGCSFISQLKDIGGHLKLCRETRERALPVISQENKLDNAYYKMHEMNSEINKKFEALNLALTKMKISINDINKEKDEEKLSQERKWAEQNRKWAVHEQKWVENDKKIDAYYKKLSEINSKQISLNEENKKVKDEIAEITKLQIQSENSFLAMEIKTKKRDEHVNKLNDEMRETTSQFKSEIFKIKRILGLKN